MDHMVTSYLELSWIQYEYSVFSFIKRLLFLLYMQYQAIYVYYTAAYKIQADICIYRASLFESYTDFVSFLSFDSFHSCLRLLFVHTFINDLSI